MTEKGYEVVTVSADGGGWEVVKKEEAYVVPFAKSHHSMIFVVW
jgi:hypothetical protein